MKSAHVLVWFRRNLRLHDNAALNAAVASGLPIACVWVSQRPSENHTSFSDGLLDCPHYTKPLEFQGMSVPNVLRSGNHGLIAEWRLKQSLQRTLERRPDLLAKRSLIPKESRLLKEILQEQQEIQS